MAVEAYVEICKSLNQLRMMFPGLYVGIPHEISINGAPYHYRDVCADVWVVMEKEKHSTNDPLEE
jgi:hypothetical protein